MTDCKSRGYDPSACPLNRQEVKRGWGVYYTSIPYPQWKHYAVRTNDSCPATKAGHNPRTTYAGWYDDAAETLANGRLASICPHGAQEAWFQGMMNAAKARHGQSDRIINHLNVAVDLGFGEWRPCIDQKCAGWHGDEVDGVDPCLWAMGQTGTFDIPAGRSR